MSATIEKIKKLLALAGNNSSESEAARAMEMASALMMKHGIEMDQVEGASKPKVGKGTYFDNVIGFHHFSAQAVAELMGCQVGVNGKDRLFFIGRPENTSAAEETHVYVILQIEQLYKQSLPKGLTQRDRAHYRKNFKVACAQRLIARVRDIISNQGIEPTGATTSTSRALVVNHRIHLKAEIDDWAKSQGWGKTKGKTARVSGSGIGSMEGRQAASQVDLNKGVGK